MKTSNNGETVFNYFNEFEYKFVVSKNEYKEFVFYSRLNNTSPIIVDLVPNIIFEYLSSSFIFFDSEKYLNYSDSARNEIEFIINNQYSDLTYDIIGFSDMDEVEKHDTLLSYKRALFVYEELIKLGFEKSRLNIISKRFKPFYMDSFYSQKSSSLFLPGDILSDIYIQNLSNDKQIIANLYNRRVLVRPSCN